MTQARNGAEYVLDLCTRIAACTDVPGTITRTFLSPATRAVHALVCAEMEALGMQPRVDSAGNVRGIYAAQGLPANAARFLLGSHLDTVPDAGAYDGVLGVAMALALLRELARERRYLPYAIEIIAFSEEEGVRFRLPFIGSRAAVGTLTADDLQRKDENGTSLAQAIAGFGLHPEELLRGDSDALLSQDACGFLEIHIEQGPVLEAEGVPLGVVGTIVGQSRYDLRFQGQANHAGTTPMHLRHDALAAAAAWVTKVESLADATPGLVATVGMLQAQPGVANVIAGACAASLDVRHCADDVRLRAVTELLEQAEQQAHARGVRVMSRQTSCQASVAMEDGLQNTLLTAAAAAGVTAHRMHSGAGHDAMIMASQVPSAMLFVRSPGGISHHPEEAVLHADLHAALAACMHFLKHLHPLARKGAAR